MKVAFRILMTAVFLALCLSLAGCGEEEAICEHKWILGDCSTPKTCLHCGELSDIYGDHRYPYETCNEDRACVICGTVDPEAPDHTFLEAGCTKPKRRWLCLRFFE